MVVAAPLAPDLGRLNGNADLCCDTAFLTQSAQSGAQRAQRRDSGDLRSRRVGTRRRALLIEGSAAESMLLQRNGMAAASGQRASPSTSRGHLIGGRANELRFRDIPDLLSKLFIAI